MCVTTPVPECRPRYRLGLALLGLAVLLLPVTRAGAEIVVFTDGDFLPVESYEVTGEQVRLGLDNGGLMVLPLLRIARILDDEVEKRPPIEAVVEVVPPVFPLRFVPAHQPPSTPYGDLIFEVAQRHALNPALVAAVVRAESAFRSNAVSPKGARGLMQLMPATAERFGVRGAATFEPRQNLDAGARYLSWLIDRFNGELPLVLAAYNAGEGTVDRYRGVPPYRETQGYIRRIYDTLGLSASLDQPAAGFSFDQPAAGL